MVLKDLMKAFGADYLENANLKRLVDSVREKIAKTIDEQNEKSEQYWKGVKERLPEEVKNIYQASDLHIRKDEKLFKDELSVIAGNADFAERKNYAYKMDAFEFKNVTGSGSEKHICATLCNFEYACVYWMSNFKMKLSVPADEFIESLRIFCELNGIAAYFYKNVIVECHEWFQVRDWTMDIQ